MRDRHMRNTSARRTRTRRGIRYGRVRSASQSQSSSSNS